MNMNKCKSIVGDVINFRGMIYAPMNEHGVTFLFSKVAEELNIHIEEIKSGFPDCIARRYSPSGWQRIALEFEFYSKNFLVHKHDINSCDAIVCWQNNWNNCPIEVIELKTIIQNISNWNNTKKSTLTQHQQTLNIAEFIKKNENYKLTDITKLLITRLQSMNDKMCIKTGDKYLSIFSPERSFATISLAKTHVKVSCFARGNCLEGTKISNERFSPRWCSFAIYDFSDIDFAIKTLSNSYKLIKLALEYNEKTHFFSQ